MIESYSIDGSIKSALDSILNEKKAASYEKKLINSAKQKYKPILDIYKDMKRIEKKAFLYEHRGVQLYRREFEKYRSLTRRLKRSYGKEVFEVDAFLNECSNRLLYSSEQIKELSEEYRELYRYAKKKGVLYQKESDILSMIGYYDDFKKAKGGFTSGDAFFLSSAGSDIIVRAIKYPKMDEKGRVIESYELTVFNISGDIIDSFSSTDKNVDFKKRVKDLQEKHGLSDLSRFDNYRLALENCLSDSVRSTVDDHLDFDLGNINEKEHLYFTQAVNHVSDDRFAVIVSANNPSFIATASLNDDDRINVTVFNEKNEAVEVFLIPNIKNRSSSGYKLLSTIMNKYSFTDEVKEFRSVDDARSYVNDLKKDKVRSIQL